jgi:hypothetical protein
MQIVIVFIVYTQWIFSRLAHAVTAIADHIGQKFPCLESDLGRTPLNGHRELSVVRTLRRAVVQKPRTTPSTGCASLSRTNSQPMSVDGASQKKGVRSITTALPSQRTLALAIRLMSESGGGADMVHPHLHFRDSPLADTLNLLHDFFMVIT